MALPKASDNPFPSVLAVEGTTPASPSSGQQRLFVDSADHKLKRVNSSGTVTIVESAAAGVAADTLWDTKGDLAVATGADTAAKLAVGTDGQVLTADSAQTTGAKWATPSAGAAGALTLLSTTTLGGAGTFDVSSISGAYNDLVIVVIARSVVAGSGDENFAVRFNNDSGSNYYQERLRGSGSTASATENLGLSAAFAGYLPQASALASSFGRLELTIQGYASTSWLKAVLWQSFSMSATTTGNLDYTTGGSLWNSTTAITRVQVLNASLGNLATGSVMRIYGRL